MEIQRASVSIQQKPDKHGEKDGDAWKLWNGKHGLASTIKQNETTGTG